MAMRLVTFRCPNGRIRAARVEDDAVVELTARDVGALLGGPQALVPVGATVVLILAAANTMADPRTRGTMPASSRLLAS